MESQIQERVVKIPLPVALIRQIDEALVAGLGGFSTRTEFFREAAENMLIELRFEEAPVEPVRRLAPAVEAASEVAPAESAEPLVQQVAGLGDLADTALRSPGRGWVMEGGEAVIDEGPLFGMHNRDYPSLWAAYRLAALSQAGPIPVDAFLDEVTDEAWEYARQLSGLERQLSLKLTGLFPTNTVKPQSAATGFRAFAIGSVSSHKGEGVSAEGAFFAWKICQVQRGSDRELVIGLTKAGWDLLSSLDGISLELPHTTEQANIFLAHLRQYAGGDWSGLRTVLEVVASQPTRTELISAFHSLRPDWSAQVAGTNAQGYVGRAREWGLVEPKQLAGRYGLTKFGAATLDQTSQNTNNHTNDI